MEQSKRVLVADDEEAIRHVLSKFLTKQRVDNICVATGEEAYDLLQREHFDFVITDLMMPGIDGLELIRRIRSLHIRVPVAITTGFGTLDLAIEALRSGAVDFIKKPFEFSQVSRLLAKIFDRQKREASYHDAMGLLTEAKFVLPNNMAILESAGRIVAKMLEHLPEYDGVYLALVEALTNAMEHGNLEIGRERKAEALSTGKYRALEKERMSDPRLGKRKVVLTVKAGENEIKYTVRDEGRGFDYTSLPDPTGSENIFNTSGRGILLIRCYMDEVTWNEAGNEISMLKYLQTLSTS